MSLLAYNDLMLLVASGVIQNCDPEQVNGTSIDITLGDCIKYEWMPMSEAGGLYGNAETSLRHRQTPQFDTLYINEKDGFLLKPGEFILAQSRERFYLPLTISAEYKLKSSMARIGLEHLNAGWCDAGWNDSVLTLELKNMTRRHDIRLYPGDRIGQMVFFKHEAVPLDRSYTMRGRYNGDHEVKGVKP